MARANILRSSTAIAPAAEPPPANLASASLGRDLAGSDALERLKQALAAFKVQALLPLLQGAVVHVQADRYREGGDLALQALHIDESCAQAWHLLAVCREKACDFTSSLKCYDRAYALDPQDEHIAYNLGHLAFRMGMTSIAEQFFREYLKRQPDSADGANNLACALRDQLRFSEAIEVARQAIYAHPELPMLWNTLATVLTEQGEVRTALTFYDEALRLDPGFVKARYNRANARKCCGDLEGALADCDQAISGVVLESEAATMRFARATMLVGLGRLDQGWDAYECRFDPYHSEVLHFVTDRPRWTPDADLKGRSLLVFAEQGLGDEVMFANVIPDVLEALGPDGRLTLAVEHRLVSLFQRAFPGACVGPHITGRVDHHSVRLARFVEDPGQIDLWSPLGSLLRRFRTRVEDFPARPRYLTADPARVAYWRDAMVELGQDAKVGGAKIGLVWKSLRSDSARHRFYSPFEHWGRLFARPGVTFVNLQYGDCEAELELAQARFGVRIWRPPGIDLKADLDEVAALACALDLTIGPPNATTNLAAACGAPTWLITTPGTWPECGTDRYPWYPQLRVFRVAAYDRWDEVMDRVAAAVGTLSASPAGAAAACLTAAA